VFSEDEKKKTACPPGLSKGGKNKFVVGKRKQVADRGHAGDHGSLNHAETHFFKTEKVCRNGEM